MFSISNVLIQSTVNTFLKVGTTANAVAHQFDAFVAMTGNGVALARAAGEAEVRISIDIKGRMILIFSQRKYKFRNTAVKHLAQFHSCSKCSINSG